MTTVKEIFRYLEHLAPLSLAESYDNPGLLAGDDGRAVTRALIALDITREVCAEAADSGAQLVISHHPVIFLPVKSVVKNGSTAALWELVHRDLAAICMHTNLDFAPGGVNDTLAKVLGLEITGPLMVTEQHAIGLTATLGADMELDAFARYVCAKLSSGSVGVSRVSGNVRRIAVCSGAWDDSLTQLAKNKGADTILTGELKHSSMLLALSLGLNVVAAGHFATEDVICGRLAELLNEAFADVSFTVARADRNPAYYISQ